MKKRATLTMQVCWFITTRPPEPTMAPTLCSESKSMGRSRWSLVRHPPEGPPICTALKQSPVQCAAVVGHSAADVEHDLPQGGAEGNFDQARVGHVAREGEGLGAGRFLRAALAEGRGPLVDDQGHAWPAFPRC